MTVLVVLTVIVILLLIAGLAVYLFWVGTLLTRIAGNLEGASGIVATIVGHAKLIGPGVEHINQPYWFGRGGDLSPEEFGLQAARGTTSHFNVSTPFDGVLWMIMGLAIVAQTLTSVAVAVALWRQPLLKSAKIEKLRRGGSANAEHRRNCQRDQRAASSQDALLWLVGHAL